MTNQNPADERGNDLELTVCRDGRHVNVRNAVSGTGEVHTVTLDGDGAATRCTCPGHRFHGHCYHTGEVKRRPLVVSAASAAAASTRRVATDGGRVEKPTGGDEDGDNATESGSAADGDEPVCDECGSVERGPGGLVDVADDDWNEYGALCHECLLSVGGPGEAPEDHGADGSERGSGGENGTGTGTVAVSGCAACDGYTTGGDEFCSDECREQGAVDETPL